MMLLGARTEQIPIVDGRLYLGRYQRVFLFGFGSPFDAEWAVTLVG
jgi:thiamine phosphate synthase YjbQ (UPF0047 family)